MAYGSHLVLACKGQLLHFQKFSELVAKPLVSWNHQWKSATEISKHYKSDFLVFQESVYQSTKWN